MSNSNKKKDILKTIKCLSEAEVVALYEKHIKPKQDEEKSADKIKTIDKTTEKYKLVLELTNGILKNINSDQITDLTDFKDIKRTDIIQEENTKMLDLIADKLLQHFDIKVAYNRKTPNIVLNCLRTLCKQLDGLAFVKTRKEIHNNDGFRKDITIYSIKKIIK